MRISTAAAREIRLGIAVADAVYARKRVRPRITGRPSELALWERAYFRRAMSFGPPTRSLNDWEA